MACIAMCTCNKKKNLDAKDVIKSKYRITEERGGVCVYCDHYVHWRTKEKVLQSIEEFTRCETRCTSRYVGLDLTRDGAYVYGYTINTNSKSSETY